MTEWNKYLQKDGKQALVKSFKSFFVLAKYKILFFEILQTVSYYIKIFLFVGSKSTKIRKTDDSLLFLIVTVCIKFQYCRNFL